MKRITFLLLALFSLGHFANAQIVLTGTSYSQNFDNIETGLPTGWKFDTLATATSLGIEAALFPAPAEWTGTAGGLKNFASADGLTETSDAAAQNGSTDRVLGVRQTGKYANSEGAFLMQIANTADRNSFELSFKLQSLDVASVRLTTWIVDYGIGTNPTSFTPLTTVPAILTTGGTTFSNTDVTVNLGNALDDINQPIWIRIATLTPTTGSGNRASTGIDDVQLTWIAGAPTVAAAPLFTPAPGTYYSEIDVTIASPTSGATVYYTLDGTTPSVTSTEYTAPVSISANTTIKAIAVKAGLDNSSVSEGVYEFAASNDITSIAQLRQQAVDNSTVYTLSSEAILTFQQTHRKQKFIQDNTAAILIDDDAGLITTAYDIADGISNISGKLSDYHGMLQFIPVADPGPATSYANIITPEIFTITQMQDTAAFRTHQAKLIRIENVKFQDADGTLKFQVNKKYRLSQAASLDSTFRTQFFDANYINGTVPAGTGSITGIVHLAYGMYNITARSSSDINLAVGVEDYNSSSVRIYPNPAVNTVNIETDKPALLTITNLLGQKVLEIDNINGLTQVNTSKYNKGVYFVSLQFENGETSSQKLIIR